jgi:pyruvate/2-oxoglutarate dehydrogenase complex dihydrolipoamide dehydrogenase (E3) component
MAKPEHFDILILGSGAGGKLLAWHMAGSGHRTAVVERRYIGGSCPNVNCLPSKNEIWSAKVAHLVRHAAQFGTVTGPVAIDMAKVRQRKREMVETEIAAHVENYKRSGTGLIMGTGRFVAPKTLEIRLNDGGTRVLTGDKVFLNVGTHAAIPSIPGLDTARPLTHIEALELDYLPSHLIVVGGGYVGLELAQACRRFGSRVTILQHGPQLMAQEDPDVAEEVRRVLTAEEIDVFLSAETPHVRGRSGKEVSLVVETASGERTIEGSDILVAVGRIPNTAGIGLDETGVEVDDRGYIRVNERLETSTPGIWAIGECAGSPHFTHVSVDDFRIIRDNLAGGKRTTHDRLQHFLAPLPEAGLCRTLRRSRLGIVETVALGGVHIGIALDEGWGHSALGQAGPEGFERKALEAYGLPQHVRHDPGHVVARQVLRAEHRNVGASAPGGIEQQTRRYGRHVPRGAGR